MGNPFLTAGRHAQPMRSAQRIATWKPNVHKSPRATHTLKRTAKHTSHWSANVAHRHPLSSISNEISEATHSAGLEEALGIPLLQGNRQASVPSIQDGDFPPMSSACDLWVLLGDGVNGIPQETKSLLTPPTEGLNGERDETPSWQSPSWIPPMFVCGSLCSGSAVLIGRLMQVGAALGVSNDNVPVDQGIRRRTLEAVVQPRLLNFELPLVVGPSAGPCRLEYLGPCGEAGLPPDPSEGAPQRMATADDKSNDFAHKRVKTIGA